MRTVHAASNVSGNSAALMIENARFSTPVHAAARHDTFPAKRGWGFPKVFTDLPRVSALLGAASLV